MLILNSGKEDFHSHSSTFSDGDHTVQEMARYAKKIGLEHLVLTDHSQAYVEAGRMTQKEPRHIIEEGLKDEISGYGIDLRFGVEADLLDAQGKICIDIQGQKGDFTILSLHRTIYRGENHEKTRAYLRAIERYGAQINCIGHLCRASCVEGVDVEKVVKAANEADIPIEINGKNLALGCTDRKQLRVMLRVADRVYVNSDAHNKYQLHHRDTAFDYLRKEGFLDRTLAFRP